VTSKDTKCFKCNKPMTENRTGICRTCSKAKCVECGKTYRVPDNRLTDKCPRHRTRLDRIN